MNGLGKALLVLRRVRWWLLAAVVVLVVLIPGEWGWWSTILKGPVAFAGFWVPWVAELVADWTPNARRARALEPSEKERIEAERQERLRRRNAG